MNMNKIFTKTFIIAISLMFIPVWAEPSEMQCAVKYDSDSCVSLGCEWHETPGNTLYLNEGYCTVKGAEITECSSLKDEDACNGQFGCVWDRGTFAGEGKCIDYGEKKEEDKKTCSSYNEKECKIAVSEGCAWFGDAVGCKHINDDLSIEAIDKEKKCPEGFELREGKCFDARVVGDNFCDDEKVQTVLKLAGYLLIIVKIAIPLILIVMGTIDLYKAVVGKDEKVLMKSLKTLMIRIALGVFIFFIPNIVNWTIDLFYETSGGTNNKQCINCVLEPNSCK